MALRMPSAQPFRLGGALGSLALDLLDDDADQRRDVDGRIGRALAP